MNPIIHLAERVSNDPSFLAYHLARYAREHGLGAWALAQHLGLPVDRLADLGLCRTPRSDADLARIAEHMGVSVELLQEVVK